MSVQVKEEYVAEKICQKRVIKGRKKVPRLEKGNVSEVDEYDLQSFSFCASYIVQCQSN